MTLVYSDHPTSSSEADHRPYACSATPLRFHTHRGHNIDLSADRTVAYRRSSYADSIVFSERQLQPNELFLVKIDRNEIGWSGNLRIGLTNFNPESKQPLPTSALPDLCLTSRSWVVSVSLDSLLVNGIVQHLGPMMNRDENSTPLVLPTDVGSRIGVYYCHDRLRMTAQMRVVINHQDIGPVYDNIPMDRPFYGVIDVYGSTKQVRTVGQVATR